jgi:hypothetical protein
LDEGSAVPGPVRCTAGGGGCWCGWQSIDGEEAGEGGAESRRGVRDCGSSLSHSLSVCLSVCLSVYLSHSLSVCLSLCLFLIARPLPLVSLIKLSSGPDFVHPTAPHPPPSCQADLCSSQPARSRAVQTAPRPAHHPHRGERLPPPKGLPQPPLAPHLRPLRLRTPAYSHTWPRHSGHRIPHSHEPGTAAGARGHPGPIARPLTVAPLAGPAPTLLHIDRPAHGGHGQRKGRAGPSRGPAGTTPAWHQSSHAS